MTREEVIAEITQQRHDDMPLELAHDIEAAIREYEESPEVIERSTSALVSALEHTAVDEEVALAVLRAARGGEES